MFDLKQSEVFTIFNQLGLCFFTTMYVETFFKINDQKTDEKYQMDNFTIQQFNMLKEEIVHYKNLVATKEKELNNLTVVFNQNMTENKHEVRF